MKNTVDEIHFKIIIPSYNNEKWLRLCIRSVKLQNYNNYQCIITDDHSSDKSVKIIKEEINKNSKFVLVENKEQKLALRNIYEAIILSDPANEDVIITLDGDDWFATKNVLKTLNKRYREEKCWLTYGSYMEYPSMTRGKFSKQIPKEIIDSNSFRESSWMSSHLRTFKFKLWKRIKKEDFLEDDGRFCDGAWDMIFMFPMLEMGRHRCAYIEDILHIYNRTNPLNEDKVDHQKLIRSEMMIRAKEKYKEATDDN
jgi:glycosyltransferase involved in cell wall biosynthesis